MQRPKYNNVFFRLPFLSILLIAFIVMVNTGCAHINAFKEAKTTYESAVKGDISEMFGSQVIKDLAGNVSLPGAKVDKRKYGTAFAAFTKLIKDFEPKLKKSNLLGDALALQALSGWKAGKHKEALVLAQKALLFLPENQTRDVALMTALPGLIKSDEAFGLLSKDDTKYSNISKLIGDGLKAIKTARALSEGKPIERYLLLSELNLHSIWKDSFKFIGDDMDLASREVMNMKASAKEPFKKLGSVLKANGLSPETIKKVGNTWNQALGGIE